MLRESTSITRWSDNPTVVSSDRRGLGKETHWRGMMVPYIVCRGREPHCGGWGILCMTPISSLQSGILPPTTVSSTFAIPFEAEAITFPLVAAVGSISTPRPVSLGRADTTLACPTGKSAASALWRASCSEPHQRALSPTPAASCCFPLPSVDFFQCKTSPTSSSARFILAAAA